MALPTEEQIYQALRQVQDPEMRLGIVDLGLIYDVAIKDDGKVMIKMTLTSPACPFGEQLLTQTHEAAAAVDGVSDVEIALVWDPTWDPKEMASDLAKDVLGIW